MIIAANLKTNHTRESTRKYIDWLSNYLTRNRVKNRTFVFPPLTALENYEDKSINIEIDVNLKIGVQNSYPIQNGSFTGEIGLEQLDEFMIDTILIGHSERRHILGESHELIIKKFNFFKEQNFEIIYCIGEPLKVREQGIDEVMKYLENQLKGIDTEYEELIIAYEPVWAIGTGVSATIEQINETHNKLREKLNNPIIYGGSVKPQTAEEIMRIKNCDGILVGTASWKVENFIELVDIGRKITG